MGMGWNAAAGTHRSFVQHLSDGGHLIEPMFTMCLTPTGGSMVIGGSDPSLHTSPVQWARLTRPTSHFYVVVIEDVLVEGTSLGVSASQYNDPGSGCIVDSGTTFSYLPSAAHSAMVSQIRSWCSSDPQHRCKGQTVSEPGESLCWKLDDRSYLSTFPEVRLKLAGADGSSVYWDVAASEYLLHMVS